MLVEIHQIASSTTLIYQYINMQFSSKSSYFPVRVFTHCYDVLVTVPRLLSIDTLDNFLQQRTFTLPYLDQKNGHKLPTGRGLENHSLFTQKKIVLTYCSRKLACTQIRKNFTSEKRSCHYKIMIDLKKRLCHLNCAHFCPGDRSTTSLLAQHCFWSPAK